MDMKQTRRDETNNGNKMKEEGSKPEKHTCQKAIVWYFIKIYTWVDQHIKHRSILKSI